jgi:ribonuclease BN (tRNA processing enzyme)
LISIHSQVRTRSSGTYGERPGGLDIYPDKDGQYFLFEEDQLKVMAAPTEHTVPCVGYVISEKTKPGRLKVEDVLEAVNRNKKALAAKFNLRDPNKIFAVLKDMKPGSSLVFPDGTVMNADEILEPPRSGRKVRDEPVSFYVLRYCDTAVPLTFTLYHFYQRNKISLQFLRVLRLYLL